MHTAPPFVSPEETLNSLLQQSLSHTTSQPVGATPSSPTGFPTELSWMCGGGSGAYLLVCRPFCSADSGSSEASRSRPDATDVQPWIATRHRSQTASQHLVASFPARLIEIQQALQNDRLWPVSHPTNAPRSARGARKKHKLLQLHSTRNVAPAGNNHLPQSVADHDSSPIAAIKATRQRVQGAGRQGGRRAPALKPLLRVF
ncbi:hypothetical protein IWX90DRAFT_147495 [Phyllosticta citrichinensis]|uniref:Uncharacterized protein n=1 Tax=Phyllosticta citrichinensis TaxID=1130410 RepID=A0ABR1XZM3_9PEZI